MPKRKRRSVTGLRRHKAPKAATSTVSTGLRNSQTPEIVARFMPQPQCANNPELAPVRANGRNRIPRQALDQVDEPEHVITVESQKRYISQETIHSRWQVQSEAAQASIMQLFKSIEMLVLASHEDERRRIEAQVVLSSVIRTLGNRLPRMPFPPQTNQSHFEYETTLNDIRKLEHRLDQIVHSSISLKVEIGREQHALENEERKLEDLGNELRTSESMNLRQKPKHHELLPLIGGAALFDGSDTIDLVEHKTSYTLNLEDPDAKLQDLVAWIRNHSGRMQNNAKQTAGIQGSMLRAEHSLEDLLRQQ